MVSRILDNSRYWDGEQYPPIVEREIAMKVADLKQPKTPSPDRQFIKTPNPDPFSGTLGDHFPPGNDRLFRFQQSCQDCPLLLEHGP